MFRFQLLKCDCFASLFSFISSEIKSMFPFQIASWKHLYFFSKLWCSTDKTIIWLIEKVMTRSINNENNLLIVTRFCFSDAFPTCANMEAAALRAGAPSPATARGRDTLEPPVTTVSSSSHFHFFTSPQTRHHTLCSSPYIRALLSCVIWFSAHTCLAPTFLHFVQLRGKAKKLALPQPDMTLQSSLLLSPPHFRGSVLFFATSLNNLRLAVFRLTPHVAVFLVGVIFWHPPTLPWYLLRRRLSETVWNSSAPEYWFLVYIQTNAVFFACWRVHDR